MIEIEKGVPLPSDRHRNGYRSTKYGFERMEVGDSIVQPSTRQDTTGCNAVAAAHGYGQRHHKRFASSYIGDYKVRIWRVQ